MVRTDFQTIILIKLQTISPLYQFCMWIKVFYVILKVDQTVFLVDQNLYRQSEYRLFQSVGLMFGFLLACAIFAPSIIVGHKSKILEWAYFNS